MAHNHDFWRTIRKEALVPLHKTLQRHGLYSVRPTPPNQYVATIPAPVDDVEDAFHKAGFGRNWLSAYKHLKHNPQHYEASSWVKRPSPLSRWQLHVILFSDFHPETTAALTHVYAHQELNYLRHPVGHYTGTEYSAETGVEMASDWLMRMGLDITAPPPPR